MSFSFKYRKETFKGKSRYFPKIPVVLFNLGKQFQTAVLLDSGATNIFIPKAVADLLELKLENSDSAESWAGDFKVWESRMGVVVGKGSQTFRKVLPCLVADKETEHGEVIFGRDFFRFFEITFNENKKITKLKRTC